MSHEMFSPKTQALQKLISQLRSEGLLAQTVGEDENRAENSPTSNVNDPVERYLKNTMDTQPWYIRSMVAFGAWVASLLLVLFFVGVGFIAEGAFLVIGLLLVGAATLLRYKYENDFLVQLTLACSLSGQALIAFGIVEIFDPDNGYGFTTFVIALSVLMFFIFPDRIHRVITVLVAAFALGALIIGEHHLNINPFVGPLLAIAMVWFYQKQASFFASGKGHLVRPLITGLMLAAFGFLMISTVYILPSVYVSDSLYPRPWISTLMLGALLIYVGNIVWPHISVNPNSTATLIFFTILLVVIAAAWAIPGLLLALIVILLGVHSGDRLFIGAGLAFLVIFISAYFYGTQVSMLTKSITLISTGTVVLIARWLLLKLLTGSNVGVRAHD